MRVARLFLLADWPEKYFSGQSEGENSNASGTGSVRVSAQGLSRSCCKLSPMKIPSSRLAGPGSPRMPHPWVSSEIRKGSRTAPYGHQFKTGTFVVTDSFLGPSMFNFCKNSPLLTTGHFFVLIVSVITRFDALYITQ